MFGSDAFGAVRWRQADRAHDPEQGGTPSALTRSWSLVAELPGLEIVSKLPESIGRTSIAVTLIDREPAYVWKPMLHTIAAGTTDVSQQETSYISQARNRRFVFEPGELKGINRKERKVYLNPLEIEGRPILPERAISYDTLILATGSEANDFGTPGVRDHCLTIDNRSQAMNFNREVMAHMLEALAAKSTLHIAVVGGGATGVELAAELVQLADASAYYGAAGLRDQVKVTLIESGPNLLGAFPDRVAIAARERLERLGVTVLTGARVVAAEAGCLRLADGTQINAELKVWAAGVKASDVCAAFDGLEVTRNNQIVVGPTLQTTLDPRIFAVGDCSSLSSGRPRQASTTGSTGCASAGFAFDPPSSWLAGREGAAPVLLPGLRFDRIARRLWRLRLARTIRTVQGRLHTRTRGSARPCPSLSQPSVPAAWILAWRADMARGHDQFPCPSAHSIARLMMERLRPNHYRSVPRWIRAPRTLCEFHRSKGYAIMTPFVLTTLLVSGLFAGFVHVVSGPITLPPSHHMP